MRNPALIAIAVLCSFTTGCNSIDTAEQKEWPRFSSEVGPSSPDAVCPPIGSRQQAVRLFSVCMDQSIGALKALTNRDPVAMSDLAAAYYFRASQQDEPADYLNAYDAAKQAMKQVPRPEWAEGNLKAIEKSLGLDRIEPAVLHPDDPKSIARYPGSALLYLENELLPDRLPEARRLAAELVRITGDRYPLDEVEACAVGGPALKAGYSMLRDARAKKLESSFIAAAEALRKGRSPASLYADAYAGDLDRVEQEARKRGYLDLQALVLSMRGFVDSNYLESLVNYDKALRIYQRLHNPERLAYTQTRRLGILRVTGQLESGWRQARQEILNLGQVATVTERNLLLGETSRLVLALGHPDAALRYANVAVHIVEQQLVTPTDRTADTDWVNHNLGIAKRRRAGFELVLDEIPQAQADLDSAMHLAEKQKVAALRQSVEARLAEVRAQLAMHVDPAHAPDKFTEALAKSKDLEYPSFRASLYAQRAAAERAAGRPDDAENDLRNALAELDREESSLLANRKQPDPEMIVWNDYFSRFQETYHDLIRYLVPNRADEAFKYADRARAFEPLNLALKLTPANGTPVDMAKMQQVLAPGTFLIEYTVFDDHTFAWVITHGAGQVVDLKPNREKVERWNNSGTIDTTLRAAYDELLAEPLEVIRHMPESATPRLVIVPDGTMNAIPFAALYNTVSHRYLIEDAPVSIAGSAALYALSVERDRELKNDVSALLVGNPQSEPPLPAAEEEVQEIARQYAPHATVRTGTEATVDDFLARAGESAIVHIGAHAVIDARWPPHSRLLFASGELDAAQLLARFKSIRTRLVVLGACSSAGGLPVGPQGVAPLVRPLIARGVPAVVGTLWDVEDATAKELLVSFHQHYRKGNDAAVAMQQAQIELLRNPNEKLRSVLAWAPYQVIGYASSPFPAPRH